MRVERAKDDPEDDILELLVSAMREDPFVSWLARAGRGRERAFRSYVSLMLGRIALKRGEVWVANGEEGLLGAALWAPPNTFELGAAESLRVFPLMVDVVGLTRMSAVTQVLSQIDEARPREPRWLLTVLGVREEARGRGVGTALLAPVLERCDEAGERAVAETASEDNLRFYRRLGFTVLSERALPREGARSWTLVREPRARYARPGD